MRAPAGAASELRSGADGGAEDGEPPDLRMVLLGAAAWCGGLLAHSAPRALLGLALAVAVGIVVVLCRRTTRPAASTAVGALLLGAGVVAAVGLRHEQLTHGPVAALTAQRAVVSLEATVTSDPRPVAGRFGDLVLLRMDVRRLTGRGTSYRLVAPVMVLADEQWAEVPLGSTVRATGRLGPPRDPGTDLAAVLQAAGPPVVRAGPDVWWRAAATVRASLRRSVEHRPEDQRVLVPALVNGDDAGLDPALAEDFRATGLTHLTAVSGTNLTLVVGCLLLLARWAGVRGRWLYVVGAAGIAGFVLLSRTEPSVVRAAAMGAVGLVAMGSNGRQRGSRALGVAVAVLLLVDPALAVSVGFALSVLATAGILLLAPGLRDALGRWTPRWLAEAVAVPTAAQLACTPVVAAISGQVSLVAVLANLLVLPAVGPATVLGLAGGLVGLVSPAAGQVVGTTAAWCVAWIIAVARAGADLPTAAIGWGTGPVALASLTVLTVALTVAAPWVLRHRAAALVCVAVLVLAVAGRLPDPGWPPPGWVMVACDVGQGDALAVRAGPASAIVVDAGPDPRAADACLDRLGVHDVPLVVLTHFHADHVAGLTGVLEDRQVGVVETSTVLDPADGAAGVDAATRAAGVPARPAELGTRVVGEATVQVLWPDSPVTAGPGDGSAANDASVVLLVEVRGVRLLLTGDLEPPGQAALARVLPDLEADVLKLPHHGSRYQDLDFLRSLGADAVVVSVGEGNDYGHPATSVLEELSGGGVEVGRTDLGGDVAVVVEEGRVDLRTRS